MLRILTGVVSLGIFSAASSAQTWLPPAPAGVEVTETYGIQFSTIGAPGNAPVTTFWRTEPRFEGLNFYERPFGTVDTPYRIARSEVTTDQWMEFLNAFAGARSREWFEVAENRMFRFFAYGPLSWGAYSQRIGIGYQWRLWDIPDADRVPVNGILLPTAMMYCNWLHNGKSSDWDSLLDGAYDMAQVPPVWEPYRATLTRRPEARFWIPSADEWVKAAHFDPAKNGPGRPGYWEFAARTDLPVVYAPPYENGDANAGFEAYLIERGGGWEWRDAYTMPLGSYPHTQSAYGLLDCLGAMEELTDTLTPAIPTFNVVVEGSNAWYPVRHGTDASPLLEDHLGYFLYGDVLNDAGLRIAARKRQVADLDDNGFLDLFDYIAFFDCMAGVCPDGMSADLNGDGIVDAGDAVVFVDRFLSGE